MEDMVEDNKAVSGRMVELWIRSNHFFFGLSMIHLSGHRSARCINDELSGPYLSLLVKTSMWMRMELLPLLNPQAYKCENRDLSLMHI